MARLEISLLGSIDITLDGKSIEGFKSNKVRALLAYLAMEAARAHRRTSLAALLWPDWTDQEALSNLRYSLSNLRTILGDRTAEVPHLVITRDSIQFNQASDHWLDAAAFLDNLRIAHNNPGSIEALAAADALYRGSFLEGFHVDESQAFEDWMALTRERLAREAIAGLHALADHFEQRQDYRKVQEFAWRQLKLEPWNENAHQRLMRALAFSGQRSAALAQYDTLRQALKEELGVEPSAETIELYEGIRSGTVRADGAGAPRQAAAASRPKFLEGDTPVREAIVVVAREAQLAKLDGHLQQALAGHGQVVFVTGEAGSGKTTLVHEFTRLSQARFKDLVVAQGNCNAYTGIGDPYLPFREILELLTGDIESGWAAGTITRELALRLWHQLPLTLHALVLAGPDLIDTFLQKGALLARASTHTTMRPEQLRELHDLLERRPQAIQTAAALHQVDLFEQYTRVMHMLEQNGPLILVIDDLQWADAGSINLLFHMGRRIQGSRILIIGIFRPEEVALGRGESRHPLEPVVNELRREFGDNLLGADKMDGRKFIEALLDSEPNHLGPSFRAMLYHQTQGHPLFTIELLRGLQERGDIRRDEQGFWIEGQSLDWLSLPARVEAAIQERISRLPAALQKALVTASVEGETFTAEVLAHVDSTDEREMLEALSGELDRKHRLVQAQSIQQHDGRTLSRYRFRHILFQNYLYGTLDAVQRAHLHARVGMALEGLYGAEAALTTNAVQLARHFEEAQNKEKAVQYLYNAGRRAVNLCAYREGITHLGHALDLLELLPDSAWHVRQELDLLLSLGIAWQGNRGAQSPEVKETFTRAHELARKTGSTSQLVQVIGGLVVLEYVRGEYQRAREHAAEGLALAEKTDEPLLALLCHWYLGFILFSLGELSPALMHLRFALDLYDPDQHHFPLIFLRGSDAGMGAMAYAVCCLWCLGYPDQAAAESEKVLKLAYELNHAFTLADVLCFGGCLFNAMRRDGHRLGTLSNELIQLSRDRSMAGWLATGMRYQGEALLLQGKPEAGEALVYAGIDAMAAENIYIHYAETYTALAEDQLRSGDLEGVKKNLDLATAMVTRNGERYWEAEIHRLRGELLLRQGHFTEAEACLRQAVDLAHRQGARCLELRAVLSLVRCQQSAGCARQALQLLADVYAQFSEGFDTAELIEARSLLDAAETTRAEAAAG